jgi:hypothetical protein
MEVIVKYLLVIFSICVVVILSTTVPSISGERPVQLSLFTPIQIYSDEHSITAFRLNVIYGRNISVRGLDLGLVNHMTSGLSKGVQIGFIGLVDADFLGWQNNAVNVTRNGLEGFQWGIVNYAGNSRGFQLGVFNYTETMYGLQIGLINVIRDGGVLPVLPIVNWSF